MVYNRNIPQPTDLISNSQPQLLGNFQTIDAGSNPSMQGVGIGFDRNHVSMTAGANGGLHNRIDFFQNIATPAISGFVAALYPLDVSGASELTYARSGATTQITSGSNAIWKGGSGNGVVTATIASSGTMTLPNGLVMKWGRSASGAQNQTIGFSPAFPNACFNVQVTVTAVGTTATPSSVQYPIGFQPDQFVFRYNGSSINGFFWFAIGN